MNKLFNTPFESGMRAMMVLAAAHSRGMTVDRITAYDFMTIYGKSFEISEKNLHGDNSLNFSEFSAKRALCSEGIKAFVLDGLIGISRTKNGFLYRLTSAGRKYIETLDSDYKTQYMQIAAEVHRKYSRKSDAAILKEINDKAVKSLRR